VGRSAKPRKSTIRSPRKPRARAGDPGVIGAARGRIRGGFGASWSVAVPFAPNFDAVTGLDHVSDGVLTEHLFAVQDGAKADGSGLQAPLSPRGKQGRFAAAGQRPNKRGFTGRTTRPFADNLERAPIKVNKRPVKLKVGTEGTRAKTSIRPDPLHRGFVGFEERRGHEYFFADGPILRTVDKALEQWLELAVDGTLKRAKKKTRKAKKSKSR
jgi:hypothetical protein